MTESEYRAHPAANFSTLKWLLKSPAHCKAIMDGEKDVEVTSAMSMGTAVHAFWLEGIVPVEGVTYRRKPAGMSFASKEGRAWRDSTTLPILTEEEEAIQHSMVRAMAESPHCRRLLELAPHRETPLFATIEGVGVKCRVDAFGSRREMPIFAIFRGVKVKCWADAFGPGVMLDLKTTNDASPKKFGSIAYDKHYDLQAWLYREILLQNELISQNAPGIWLAVENTGVPIVMPYFITSQFMDSGRDKGLKCLSLWKQCHESGQWPGYPMPEDGTPAIPEFPRWATNS